MKNTFAKIAVCLTIALTGCGLQEDEKTTAGTDAGGDTDTGTDGGTTPTPDTTDPTVTITSPADGSGSEASTVTVTGTASDNVGVASVKVNGVDCTLSGGTFSCEDVPLGLIAGNEVTLTAEAKDAAGRKGTASIKVLSYMPAPFRSSGANSLEVSVAYISASLCAELRGTRVPTGTSGLSWSSGPFVQDLDASGNYDGYMSTVFTLAAGSYQMSYVDRACPGEVATPGNWADYGNVKLQISKMSPTARSFLYCEQYVPSSNSCQAVSNPGCNIRFDVDSGGGITATGNMGGFNAATATGCW